MSNFWMKPEGLDLKYVRNKLLDLEQNREPKPRKRHLDEINSVQSIFYEDSFTEYSNGYLDIECIFNIQPILPKHDFQIFYFYNNPKNLETPVDFGSLFVEFLPLIRFYLKLPTSYPLKNPPDYTLDISWLPPWESSKVCQTLDQLWIENQGNEILFIWVDFLKNRLFDFLDMQEKIDISYLFALYKDKDDLSLKEIIKWRDLRVSKPINQCPVKYLDNYDKVKRSQKFRKSFHLCEICLERKSGLESVEIENCRHTFCKNCMKEYMNWKINMRIVNEILCPKSDCSKKIEFDQIRKICDEKMFHKYEELLLKVTLNTMKDAVTCARKSCEYPVIRENQEDNLVTCANCSYSFCVYCRKVYHGVSPCDMSKIEQTKLIKEYINASNQGKKLLQLRYGKKQIEVIVERFLTQQYLKENTKPCPNCSTQTTKEAGCNLMTCSYCQKKFCWICGILIQLKDPYRHFTETRDQNNNCGGRLFEGVIPETILLDLDQEDLEANLEFFQAQN